MNEEFVGSEAQFRVMVENALDLIAICNPDNTFRYINPAMEQVLGYRPEEVLGTTIPDLIHPEDIEHFVEEMSQGIMSGSLSVVGPIEIRWRHKDGSYRYLESYINNLIDDPDVRGVVGTARDVTERKQAEKEIQRLNETLESRVAERTEQLAERESLLRMLVGKLVAAQEEERRRIAYEVHDGLAQLAAASYQQLQAVVEERSSVTDEDLEQALDLIRQTVVEARHVVAGLRPTILEDFGLAAAVMQQVTSLRAEGWRIEYKEALGEERLPADVEMSLYRVAQEALTNVRKHAHTTQVRITLTYKNQKVHLEVRDRGCGFEQPAMPESGSPGERVGLSSMRERVALLGGELKITSKPGKGTSVVAEVPLEILEDGSNPESGTTLARILIVDDHALVREGIRAALADAPDLVVVGEASNGLEAIELCRSSKPDLVIMDVRMPKMDGLTATRDIKSEHPSISVLISTTYENPDYMLEAIRAGAAGYVLKGITKQRLLNIVRRVLDGDSPLNQEVAARLLRRLAGEVRQQMEFPEPPGRRQKTLLEQLTTRELEVLRYLPSGKTNQQIARELVVNRSTVKTHVAHIIGKLGVSDRTQAAVLAIELGLLPG